MKISSEHKKGKITATKPARPTVFSKRHESGIMRLRDSFVFAPAGRGPLPLVVMLHGAGHTAAAGMDLLLPFAEKSNLLVLALLPLAGRDIMAKGSFGTDVANTNVQLATILQMYPVDHNKSPYGALPMHCRLASATVNCLPMSWHFPQASF